MKIIWSNGFSEIYAQLVEGWGSICHGYMCIVLYMKLSWCNGFPEIYAQLGGTSDWGISQFYYMWNCFDVVVLYRSIVNWRRGWGQSAMGICVFCYTWKLFGVVLFQRSMLNWRCEVVSICHGYMCILLYMKLIWCNGFPENYAQLEGGYLPNMNSLRNLLLLHRCFFYKRPIKKHYLRPATEV